MKYINYFNEARMSVEQTKRDLESMFPDIENLERIGSGKLGHAYLGSIGNDLVVVKMTNSLSEYYMSKIAMVSNPPHTVKFHNVDVFNDKKFLYGIVHDYVSRDAIPDEKTWEMAIAHKNGLISDKVIYSNIKTNEEKYEFNLIKQSITELEEHFGTDIDVLWENWGYDDNNQLVIFDLDGNISRPKYEEIMSNINK